MDRLRAAVVVLASALAGTACRRGPAPRRVEPAPPRPGDAAPSVPFDRAAEERAVYAAVLRDMHAGTLYVVEPLRTRFGMSPEDVRDRIPEVPVTLVHAANDAPAAPMPRDLRADRPVEWFSKDDWRALPVAAADAGRGLAEIEGRWTTFRTRFAGAAGHVDFTAVGFSADGRLALLHTSRGVGSLAYAAHVVLLEKTSAGWRVRKTAITVVA